MSWGIPRVAGNTSVKKAAANADLRVAAKQVGVRGLIQGSVRAEEQRVRVTFRFLDGVTVSGSGRRARALAARESGGTLQEIYRLYHLATATDPGYAPGHAGLAGLLIQGGDALGGTGSKQRALEEARRAMALDPRLPAAYTTLILYHPMWR